MKFHRTSNVFLSRIAALVAVVLLAGSASAEPAACKANPYVVKIHADWCGSCKAVESVWKQIETDLASVAVAVNLDVSDRAAYTASQERAEELGIGDFFHEYRGRTGTVAVFDCNTREPVVILNGERDLEKYRRAIARASGAS